MKTCKLISINLVPCVFFVLLVLCSCGGDDSLLTCGDGVIDTELGETCDDGNTDDGDDCPADCILVSVSDICGDGTKGETEECDDGNTVSEDWCSDVCKVEYCSDWTVQAGLGEACDDGNLVSNDGCSSMCQVDTEVTPVTTETVCSDGLDDDSDGAVDCADSDCVADAACVTETGTDADADGYTSDTDCDDTNAAVNPGASEVCDDLDNDCDGTADEEASDAATWYADADTDTYGDPNTSITACDQPSGYVSDNTDCNDNDASVNPAATEVAGNSIDEDCSGLKTFIFSGSFSIETEATYDGTAFLTGFNIATDSGGSTEMRTLQTKIDNVEDSDSYDAIIQFEGEAEKKYNYNLRSVSVRYDTSVMKVFVGEFTGTGEGEATQTKSVTNNWPADFNTYAVAILGVDFELQTTSGEEYIKWGEVEADIHLMCEGSAYHIKTYNTEDDRMLETKVDVQFEGSSKPKFKYTVTYAIIALDWHNQDHDYEVVDLKTAELQNGGTGTVRKSITTHDPTTFKYFPVLTSINLDVSSGTIDTAAKMRQVSFNVYVEDSDVVMDAKGNFNNNADDIVITTGVTVLGIPTESIAIDYVNTSGTKNGKQEVSTPVACTYAHDTLTCE